MNFLVLIKNWVKTHPKSSVAIAVGIVAMVATSRFWLPVVACIGFAIFRLREWLAEKQEAAANNAELWAQRRIETAVMTIFEVSNELAATVGLVRVDDPNKLQYRVLSPYVIVFSLLKSHNKPLDNEELSFVVQRFNYALQADFQEQLRMGISTIPLKVDRAKDEGIGLALHVIILDSPEAVAYANRTKTRIPAAPPIDGDF